MGKSRSAKKPKASTVTRKCITCGAGFKSTGPHHRMCTRCRHDADDYLIYDLGRCDGDW